MVTLCLSPSINLLFKESVTSISLSRDNRFILSTGGDLTVRMYPLSDLEHLPLFRIFQYTHYLMKIGFAENRNLCLNYCSRYHHFLNSAYDTQSAACYQSFFVTPYLWNIFHLSAILEKNQIFDVHFSYPNFKVPFLLDLENKTPLHYLSTQGTIDHPSINFMLNYMVDYLSDKSYCNYYQSEQIHKSLSGLFHFIMRETNSKTKNRYLKICYTPSLSSTPLPQFGESETRSTFSTTTTIQPYVQKHIHKPGQDRVTFGNTMVRCDYDITSDDMFRTAVILSSTADEETFKTPFITRVVDNLWKEAQHTIVISGLFFSIWMLLFSVYLGLGERMLGLEVVLILLACMAFAGEAIQFKALREKYTSSIFNWADATISLLMIVYIAMRMADNTNSLAQNWISSLVILIGYLRWISFLRYFKATSKSINSS